MWGFSYASASASNENSPCSNVPIVCPMCSQIDPNTPAIWKYTAKEHMIQ
ncbi:hypothetical protein EV421DRAFT_1714038 [Armillaria borealis]|uniref:Uncharacterized protein n=1 Tax=Armillaria borealis TaxID=47425 RepID=A0AA39JA18_9AGAR|nr:hypothetical protein EV421DRAFT_1714038 [Armillaria borealis]